MITDNDIKNLSGIEFEQVLKACLKRLQDDDKQFGNLVIVKHEGYSCSTLIVPYIDSDESAVFRFSWNPKQVSIGGHLYDIESIIK